MREETRARLEHAALRHLAESGPTEFDDDFRQLTVPLPSTSINGVITQQLHALPAKSIRWLWPGHIPYGSLTLVIGDPGLGKSQLTLDLAARVTQGATWPDGADNEVGNVLLLSSEDSVERTVIPRLQASNADLERLVVLTDIQEGGKRRMFNLKTDLERLEKVIEAQYIDMVVIDPLNGYLGDTNSWKESEVRNVLGPACAMADRHDVALIGVVHLNKDNTRSAIHRVLGSVAFSAVTRAMFAVAPHQVYPKMRYFVSVKQNYTAPPATLGFTLGEGGGLVWDGQNYTSVTADTILVTAGAPEDKAERRNAREFLQTLLANGPVKTKDIALAAMTSLISDRMLQRAKYDLKVQSIHVGSTTGTGVGGYWQWRLP